jgi:hypothetical protein
MTNDPLYQSKRFVVTPVVIRSKGDAYRLADIAHVRLRRPLLPFVAVSSAGALALVGVFWPELYLHEQIAVVAVCVAALAGATQLGRLHLHSLALGAQGGGVIHGHFADLVKVKRAIEEQLIARASLHEGVASVPSQARTENEH